MSTHIQNQAVLLLGTNLGNKTALLSEARQLIEERCGSIILSSSIYETEAWGFEGDAFLNQVIVIQTTMEAAVLLDQIHLVEQGLGRIRTYAKGYTSRKIDIDILYFNSSIINTIDLCIPHPRMHLRKFTMIPLAQILPDFIHPELGKSNLEILSGIEDAHKVSLYSDEK